jgi:hypothetical protein
MANDKRFIVKNGLSGPEVRFANSSNTTAVLDFKYASDGTLNVVGNTTLGTLLTIRDSNTRVLTVNGAITFGASGVTVNSTFYTSTANNASFVYGKQEGQLNVNAAVYAVTANNSNSAYGKQESQLSVANAVFAQTANNSLRFNGKQESQLAVNSAASATTANNATYAYGKQESQLYVANAVFATTAGSVLGGGVSGTVGTANNSTYLNGKQESQLNVNNATTSQTANNALYLNGRLDTFFTNATNISTGTLAEPRLPFRMDQNVRTTDNVSFANGSFSGSVSIGGDLILTGNLFSQNVQSLTVADPLMKLGANNRGDSLWGGFTIHYSGSGNTTNHAGLVRNPTNKEFILMSTYGDENAVANNNTINITDPSFSYANLQVNILRIGNSTTIGVLTSNTYTGSSNNASFAYGKQESQLNVNSAASATTANNSTYAYGKQEAQLNVNSAASATTANNATYAYGKQESQLGVNSAAFATTANNALYAYGKQESQLFVANSANSSALQGATWQAPLGIGTVTPNSGAFTTITASGATVFNGSVRLNGTALIANNSQGNPGQILSSNGSSVYWVNAGDIGGTVATANNATFAFGKNEGQLNVNSAGFATTANNALFAYGKNESQLSTNNSVYLAGRTWETAGAIGAGVANTGTFSNASFAIANTTNYISVKNVSHISADSATTTSTTQTQISNFSANTYGSAKIYIQATESGTNVRQVTELLVVHNNVVASATEYGMLFTGTAALATYEVDIVGNFVRVLATPASSTSTAFRVHEELFLQ